jgi:hypothetical protein
MLTAQPDAAKIFRWATDTLDACKILLECLSFAKDDDCPHCHIPPLGPHIAHRSSDVIHLHSNEEQCKATFLQLYTYPSYLFASLSFRQAINLPNPATDYRPHQVASFLTTQWNENLSNLHLILLLHHFLQPTTRYSPTSSQVIPSASAENLSPCLYKGPSVRNLCYLKELENAEIKAVSDMVRAKYKGTKTTTRTSQYGTVEVENETIVM